MTKIALASDHGGFILKEKIKDYLLLNNYDVIDFGTNSLESCNYATFALKAAEAVANSEANLGILVCTTGEGVCIAANKVKGIRCGIGYNDEVSRLIKEHNNANMIAFGAKYMSQEDVLKRVDIFLNTSFSSGRHQIRVDTINDFENK